MLPGWLSPKKDEPDAMNWWLYADGAATRLQGSGPSHLESLRLQLPIFKLEPSHESAHAAPPPMSIQEVNYLLHAVEVKIPIGPLPEYVLPYVRVASVVDHHHQEAVIESMLADANLSVRELYGYDGFAKTSNLFASDAWMIPNERSTQQSLSRGPRAWVQADKQQAARQNATSPGSPAWYPGI